MPHILADLKGFLDSSPTSWHAAVQLGNRFASQDFIPLQEEEKWQLERGKRYFVAREGSLCAFAVPEKKPLRALILAAHTDSPALKIKPQPIFYKENMALLGVEVYGSPLIHSWLNRDLGLAGRIIVTNGSGEAEERLVFIDDAPMIIPQLAIHLDREVNEKGLVLNKQEHLCPLIGLSEKSDSPLELIEKMVRRHLSFNKLLAFDLFLVPLEQSRFLGCEGELLASYRIDNLASVHACASSLVSCKNSGKETLQMALFFDHEEIGSRTKEGAASPFVHDIFKRIALCLNIKEEELLQLKNHSLCISTDMAHALNPNYPLKHDPQHKPLLGKGIVLKHSADQKYATNARSSAVIAFACQQLNLPLQTFVSRSDIPCGSTVGPIIAHTEGINTVDIGCPQLSMHAIREVMACRDYLDLCRLLTHLLQSS
jgi:aspartyl aminopeptidase